VIEPPGDPVATGAPLAYALPHHSETPS